MIWLRKRLWWAAIVLPLGFVVAGCDDSPVEEAGEEAGEAAEDAGEAAEDVTD